MYICGYAVEIFTRVYHVRYMCLSCTSVYKNIGLFCKRALQKRPVFCKSTSVYTLTVYASYISVLCYGVATMSRMLKNTGLFAEYRSLL